jgi:hypothetical protein
MMWLQNLRTIEPIARTRDPTVARRDNEAVSGQKHGGHGRAKLALDSE